MDSFANIASIKEAEPADDAHDMRRKVSALGLQLLFIVLSICIGGRPKGQQPPRRSLVLCS